MRGCLAAAHALRVALHQPAEDGIEPFIVLRARLADAFSRQQAAQQRYEEPLRHQKQCIARLISQVKGWG